MVHIDEMKRTRNPDQAYLATLLLAFLAKVASINFHLVKGGGHLGFRARLAIVAQSL